MSLWKMGVGININNSSFKFGTRIYASLNGSLLSGTTLTYNEDSGTAVGRTDGLMSYLNIGDKILIGPSTYTNYEGGTQVLTINSITATTITFNETLSVHFSNDDPITGIGSRCPEGWTPDSGNDLDIYRLWDSESITGLDKRGYKDRYRLQFYYSATSTGEVYVKLNDDDFLASTVHRLGMHYQYIASPTDAGAFKWLISSDSANWGTDTEITSINQSDWISYEDTITSPSSIGDNWKLYLKIMSLSSSESAGVNVDNIYFEHAKETDDESLGVYTFDDYPAFGSRKFQFIRGRSHKRLRNNFLISNDSTGGGDKTKKLVISANFKDVSSTLRDNLEILLDWQDRGFPLILHHDIPQISTNLYGFLTIKDTNLTHWSSNYCSFNLTFEER